MVILLIIKQELLFGRARTNARFFQLIHQGTKLIPADFIGFVKPLHGDNEQHDKLMSNFLHKQKPYSRKTARKYK
jgi:glucose-6-phosphate isomerase